MSNVEFNNEFDLLYNNISSNKAPGLDAYEKSVFLTKGLLEVLLSYFSILGYDTSNKRQIDFSSVTKVHTASAHRYTYIPVNNEDVITEGNGIDDITGNTFYKEIDGLDDSKIRDEYIPAISNNGSYRVDKEGNNLYIKTGNTTSGFGETLFDKHENSKSIGMPSNAIAIINELAIVLRDNKKIILQGIPINYNEYTRLMSKPFKRPLKNLAWRIINSSATNRVDIIVGPNDELLDYSFRYVEYPKPIILEDLTGLTIEGISKKTECELPVEIHLEILLKAVELAYAAFVNNKG